MQTKLIKTVDYLLLIDKEAEIKENTWYENKGLLFLSDCKYDGGNNPNNSNLRVTDFNNSIIAYYPLTKEAKELDLPLLPNPFVLSDDYIQKLASEEIEFNHRYVKEKHEIGYKIGFEQGYKAAQAKQFSLEDMIKAYDEGCSEKFKRTGEAVLRKEFIQSLSTQKLPKEFIPEYEERGTTKFWTAFYSQNEKGIDNPDDFEWNVMKTITNSKGQKVVQGDYKF